MFAYCEEWLDDIELVVLNKLNTSENFDFPYEVYDRFNLDDMDEAKSIAELRFEKRHRSLLCYRFSDEVQPEIGFHWNGRALHASEKACLPL